MCCRSLPVRYCQVAEFLTASPCFNFGVESLFIGGVCRTLWSFTFFLFDSVRVNPYTYVVNAKTGVFGIAGGAAHLSSARFFLYLARFLPSVLVTSSYVPLRLAWRCRRFLELELKNRLNYSY